MRHVFLTLRILGKLFVSASPEDLLGEMKGLWAWGERHGCERKTSICCLPQVPQLGDHLPTPGMGPDQESNWQPFSAQDGTQPTDTAAGPDAWATWIGCHNLWILPRLSVDHLCDPLDILSFVLGFSRVTWKRSDPCGSCFSNMLGRSEATS